MSKMRIIRGRPAAPPVSGDRLAELRRRVEGELPELQRRDQMRLKAQQERSRAGAVRRAVHSCSVPLSALATEAGIDLTTLDAFLSGETDLLPQILDRLESAASTGIRAADDAEPPGDSFLSSFRRYTRASAASRDLCRRLVARVLEATGALPEPTPSNERSEPPYLVYRPPEAPNFALIEVIDSRKPNVVISLYGDAGASPSPAYTRLKVRGRARSGYSKIAVQAESDLEAAVELIRSAYERRRRKLPRAG